MASLTLLVVSLTALSAQPKLLDFYSEHCGPCRQMKPVIAQLEQRGYTVQKIDVDREPQLAAQYRVDSIPCLVVVAHGREVERVLGVTPIDRLETMLRTAGTASATAAANAQPMSAPAGNGPGAIELPSAEQMAASAPPPRRPARNAMAKLGASRGRNPSTRGRQPMQSTGVPRLSPSDHVQPQGEPNEPLPSTPDSVAAAAPAGLTGIQSEQPLPAAFANSDFAGQSAPPAAFSTPAPPSAAATAPAGDWRPVVPSGSIANAPAPAAAPALSSQPAALPATPTGDIAAANAQGSLPNQLLAASVRLRIEHTSGTYRGSGTIVDVRGEDALVLTCGHIFRESAGNGKLTVDLFGPGMPQQLAGEVISYDLENDVGLVSFRPGVPVQVARVAAPGSRVQPGDPVFNTGCNNGDDPTLRSSRITTIDKYLGAPNLQVAGQPVQGRSGGGLFDAHGQVIGVCNAADPADNEGLYAALPSIYKLLDAANLADVYRPSGTLLAGGMPPSMPANQRPPHMPEQMPVATNPLVATETSAPQAFPTAAIDPAAEIVCVIRSPGSPQGKSEVIVLDQASPEFLRHLAQERARQQSRGILPAATPNGSPLGASPTLEARSIDPRAAALR